MAEPNVLSTPHTHEQTGHRIPAPCAMVIFGASGDLTERKLVPALYYLSRAHLLPDGFSVIGCAKTPYTNDTFRDKMQQAVKKYLNIPTSDHEIFTTSRMTLAILPPTISLRRCWINWTASAEPAATGSFILPRLRASFRS